jgi:hypothetical protein
MLPHSTCVQKENEVEISGSHGGQYEGDFWQVALCSVVEVSKMAIL